MTRLVQIGQEWRSPGAEIPWALVLSTPLLGPRPLETPASGSSRGAGRPPRLIVWSGALSRDDADEDVPDPRTWGQAGWSALQNAIEEHLSRSLSPLLIRPAAGHVVSDTPSCLRMLQYIQECTADAGCAGRLGLALDPSAMLAGSMLAAAEDHVTRILRAVGREAGTACVVASGAASPELCRELVGDEMPIVTLSR